MMEGEKNWNETVE